MSGILYDVIRIFSAVDKVHVHKMVETEKEEVISPMCHLVVRGAFHKVAALYFNFNSLHTQFICIKTVQPDRKSGSGIPYVPPWVKGSLT